MFQLLEDSPVASLSKAEKLFKALVKQGIVKFYSLPQVGLGPVRLFYEPHGTHPGAEGSEIFAAAAVLTQAGKVLASFNALANDEYKQHSNMRRGYGEEELRSMEEIPRLSDNSQLNVAFAAFTLASWHATWDALGSLVPYINNNFKDPNDLQRLGLFQYVHSGLLDYIETTFLYRCSWHSVLGHDVLDIFSKDVIQPSTSHPFGLHRLSSLLVGMGYQPSISDSTPVNKSLGLPQSHRSPMVNAENMAHLHWAAYNADERLAAFRLPG